MEIITKTVFLTHVTHAIPTPTKLRRGMGMLASSFLMHAQLQGSNEDAMQVSIHF